MSRPFAASFRTLCGLILALCGCSTLAAQETSSHYSGVAYAIGTQSVRYREEHWVSEQEGHQERLVLYRCPDGRPFARKQVRYANPPWMPTFEYVDARSGYRESVTAKDGRLTVMVKKGSTKRAESVVLEAGPDTVVDAGFDEFVRSHWTDLERPEGTSASFVAPARLDTLRLNIKPFPVADKQFRQFRMTLAGWLGALAPTVLLTYTASDHRLIAFEGPSNIQGEHGENQKVRIVFPQQDDLPVASLDQVTQARTTPLVTTCSR